MAGCNIFTCYTPPVGSRKGELSDWLFNAGRLSLDFLGTVGYRPTAHVERLTDPLTLRRWLLEAGLPAKRLAPSEHDLNGARAVREALYTVVDSQLGVPATTRDRAAIATPASVALLNQLATVPPPRLHIKLLKTGQAVINRHQPTEIDSLLAIIVRDALELIDSGQLEHVRRCAAADCRKLFLDTAPRQRRWCSAQLCGTRARVAAHRARQAAETGTRMPRAVIHPIQQT